MKNVCDKMMDLYRFQRFAMLVASVAGAIGVVAALLGELFWLAPFCAIMSGIGAWGVRSSTKVLDVLTQIRDHPQNLA